MFPPPCSCAGYFVKDRRTLAPTECVVVPHNIVEAVLCTKVRGVQLAFMSMQYLKGSESIVCVCVTSGDSVVLR